ncbi:MAG: hypothetical protein RLZZ618_1081 [Pseudomonadota bacterium]|jgi:competence protein ComEC
MGVAGQLQQRELFAVHVAVALCCAGLLCLAGHGLRWRRTALAMVLMSGMLTGWGAAAWRASVRMAEVLPAELEGQDLVVRGVVASLPQRSAAGMRFLFEIDTARWGGQVVVVPRTVSLGWYRGFHEQASLEEPQARLRAGQAWTFTVRLRRPHGLLNPGGFDHELHLFEQGVRATGTVRTGRQARAELMDPEAGHPIERSRHQVRERIGRWVDDPAAAGVLAALAVGDQSAIARDDWQVFRDAGVAHLMSISGLHVTMFAWLAGLLLRWLWCRSARAPLWCPAPRVAAVGGLVAATLYALFSGWGVPAQRTVWMLATVTVLQWGARRWPWPFVLLAAAVVVTALDPWALLQPGFWLSFSAVAVLMASGPVSGVRPPDAGAGSGRGLPVDPDSDPDPITTPSPWRRLAAHMLHHLGAGLRTQCIATVGLAPLTLVFFQQLSLVGFAANLVAIPLVTLLLTPLALMGAVFPPFWLAGAWIEQQFAAALQWLTLMPGAVWTVASAPLWAQAAGLLAAALGVMPLPWRLRLLAVPLVLPLLWPPVDRPDEGRFDVLAVDVGQGSAVLVRTRSHLLVYDAGPRYSADSDAGARVLLPLLRQRGEARIDRLVLSHRDLDHVGGAEPLLRQVPVEELLSSLEPTHPLQALAPRRRRCETGQGWDWDGVKFEVLHPTPAEFARPRSSNAVSCVIRVSGAQGSVLLAGDIERPQELALVAAEAPLRSDVLMVPHHGSRTSSSAAFLDAVGAQVAVVQAGHQNRFGHPVAEVLQRLDVRHIVVHASPACGAWHWSGAASSPQQSTCERDRSRRYWHHAP